eukprot:869823_1
MDLGYWVGLFNHTKSEEAFGDLNLISGMCPTGYCCDNINGCEYHYAGSASTSTCATGRDPRSILCGECLTGLAETFRSPGCQKCDDRYYLLILPIL